jgi:hypothetical protein
MQKVRTSDLKAFALLLLSSLLAACGGGGGSTPISPPVASPVATLVGTAAIGAALPNATVSVRDRTGASVCSNDPVTTGPTGSYRCVLTAASQAPFAVVVTDPDGLINPMISVIGSKPAVGSESTANVTPLTTAIAAQLNSVGDPFALLTNSASLGTLDLAVLEAVKANVVTQLASVLRSAGVDPATFDPVSSPFVGGSGTGADQMLDQIRITFDNGAPTISNVLNPTAPSVPLAGTSSNSISVVGTATVGTATFNIRDLDFAKTELERCFAVPALTRAPNPDTANRRLRNVALECQNFVASAGDAPNVNIDFLHNGYNPESYFYGLFTSADMDGALFNLPELMRYIPRQDGRDEALLNLKFRDRNGFIDNRILTAKRFPGSRPSGTQWWLIGNQRPVDVFIRAAIRQREQTIPQSILDSSTFFDNAPRSRFEVGLEVFVQRPNNNGTVNFSNNPNNAIRYVRVSGPGLPNNGLVLGDVDASLPQNWMGILNATGSNPNELTTTQQIARATSNIFRIQRTQGITGTPAFTLRPNPSVGSATAPFVEWAHPTMYGELPSATWQFDLSRVPAWSLYTFEAFCGGGTTPCHTFTSRITTPLLPAPYAATQQWHSFAAVSRSFVTGGAAATGTAEITWTPNTLAERIGSVNAYSFSPTGLVNSRSIGVPRGVFSRTVSSVGGNFPAIATTDNASGRTLQIRHTMLDGSYKDHLIQFN